ncbi:hypothetical protein V1264_009025 [Littorina saxatilis]|uniref:Uncharacterized protein n=2 Tax=Littorina saxatilis TaxID=31220 RepID=A0AAN9AR09_9CAEN
MLGLVLIVVMLVLCCRQLRSRCGGGPTGSDYDGRALQNQETELNDTVVRSHQSGRPANYESWDLRVSAYDCRAQENQGTELSYIHMRSQQNGRAAPSSNYENTSTRKKQPSVIYANMA